MDAKRRKVDPADWQSIIQKSVDSIVALKFSHVFPFDTQDACCSEASGFIVDESGLILTNRHVVSSGPFLGEAIFHDHEEANVIPVYRDPVHDFGFLRFDPSMIKYMPIRAIPLRPDLAIVGLDIRVVGNDAGEKLSILSGSISRLDRNAPVYGDMTYNDFNTQAASSTSGGSSGSPVLDINGNAVALQAGGHTKAATDFFLPLDRVARALKCIKQGIQVSRGTLQVQFIHRPFDFLRRLGLSAEVEAEIRKLFPKEIGMLVVETVGNYEESFLVPGGPCYKLFEEGDVLISINLCKMTSFVPMEEILDESVGKSVDIEIARGGNLLQFSVIVQDLHSITPDRYITVGGGALHSLSYQLARLYCVPCGSVFVSSGAGMFKMDDENCGLIIKSINNIETPNLDSMIAALKTIPDRARVPLVYYLIADVHSINMSLIRMDTLWGSFKLTIRNDATGLWDSHAIEHSVEPYIPSPMTASFPEVSSEKIWDLTRCFVSVTFDNPIKIDGCPKPKKSGFGLVINHIRGLLLVSRHIVPHALGDITLVFADSINIPGKLEYLHPHLNAAFVSYDPALLGETPVLSAPFSKVPLTVGSKVKMVAIIRNFRPLCLDTVVTDMPPVLIPQSGMPRFRAMNFHGIMVDAPMAQQCPFGVLADDNGNIQAIWSSYLGERTQKGNDQEYFTACSVEALEPVLTLMKTQGKAPIRFLPLELQPVTMVQARDLGLTQQWVEKIEESNRIKRQLFLVRRLEHLSPATTVIKELDLILTVEGKVATRMDDFASQYTMENVEMVILREGKEMTVNVPTMESDGTETIRLITWCGATIQSPHRAVLQQTRHLHSRVYVSGRSKGSPAYMYGIVQTQFIISVNDILTPDLNSFVDVIKSIPDNSFVRVRLIDFDNIPTVISVKVNYHYFPTTEFLRDDNGDWKKRSF